MFLRPVEAAWVSIVHGHGRLDDKPAQADEEWSHGNWTYFHQIHLLLSSPYPQPHHRSTFRLWLFWSVPGCVIGTKIFL